MNPLDMKNPQHKAWMEKAVNESSDSRNFTEKVAAFWADMTIKVPFTGVQLDISVDESGEPNNLRDYLQYVFAKKHILCAPNEMEMLKNPTTTHYLYDPAEVSRIEAEKVATSLNAMSALTKDLHNERKLIALTWELLRVNPSVMTENALKAALYKKAQEKPVEYLDASTDKSLEIKAEIREMVANGIIQNLGTKYLYGESVLGYTLNDIVSFFADSKRNSAVLLELRTRNEEAGGRMMDRGQASKKSKEKPEETLVIDNSDE